MWKKFGRAIATLAISLVLLVGVGGYGAWYTLFREVPTSYESPEEQFKYGSIGTENVEGVPYWIWLVLPRLFPAYLPGLGGYTSLGLTWEEGKETPVGISKTTIGIPRQGMTCAVCHHATVRDTPKEKPTIFLAAPTNKFDPQRYRRFLFDCANDNRFTADYILEEIETYNHKFSWLEKQLYRYWIIPQTKKSLLEEQASSAWMDSRPDWGPGRSDSFNMSKFKLLNQPLDDTLGSSDMMPLWNEQGHEGFAYHWDGLSTSLTESVRIGAISHGAAKRSIQTEDLGRVEQFIRELAPPIYPYEVDQTSAERGRQLFASNCALCHALGGERTGTVIPVEEVGTDRHRLDMWTQAAADAFNEFAEGYDWDFDSLRKTDGYVSATLDGLWLRASYLHNGSVPSLQDLLEKPENRTQVFYRGYDVYDQANVGFVSEGPDAERVGFKYDTRLPANGNQGHLYGTDLSIEDKQALIEYLKTL